MTATTICNFSTIKEFSSLKKFFLTVTMFLFWSIVAFAQSAQNTSGQSTLGVWTLAAEKFSVEQSAFDSYSLDSECEMIPKIILEQLSQSFSRTILDEEIYNRKQNELLVNRLSLFLQLSKEVKTRDSIVITEAKERKRKKEIEKSEKKIEEIKKQISDNLAEAKKLEEEAIARTERKEVPRLEKKKPPFRLFHKDKGNKPTEERVSLYKSDVTTLFSVSSDVKEQGYESYAFGAAAKKENIAGLLTGVIKPYGEYASVRVDLRLFPSGKVVSSVTEIGLLTDLVQLAKNLSRSLSPKLSNSMPIRIKFDIQPESALENVVVTLDDVVFNEFREEILIDAGVHTFVIEADGFNTETFSYKFADKSDFSIQIALQEKKEDEILIYFKKSLEGTFYANGLNVGEVDDYTRTAHIKVNGKNIIGQFTMQVDGGEDEEEKSLSSYFFVPAKKIEDGKYFYLKTKPIDLEYYIDKSRKRMYTGYTLLVLSLPFSFFTYGKYIEARNAYKLGYTDDVDEVNKWQKYTWYSFGISATFGVNWVVQLVRYLHTASKVFPENAKKAKPISDRQREIEEKEDMEIKE